MALCHRMIDAHTLPDAMDQYDFQVPEWLPFKQDDEHDEDPLVPIQPSSTLHQSAELTVSCGLPDTPTCRVKLTVDAGPGCGGITWPAGCVSDILDNTAGADPPY